MFDDNRIITPFQPEEKAGKDNLKYRCKPQTHLVSNPASRTLTLGHTPRGLTFREFVPGAVEHDAYALQHTLTDTDIRNEPLCVRQRLLQGAVQQLYINGQHIARIPKQLLQAAAKSGDSSDVIELPPDTDPRGVRMLIQHMLDIALAGGRPQRLRDNMNVYDSLATCQAALVLGLTRYTSHVFRTLAMSLCSRIPSHEEMDAVLRFAGTHWRLWRDMVQRLSTAVRGEEIADVEGFARFCFARPALNEALVETMQAQEVQEAQVRVWAEEKQRRFVKEEERRKMWLVDRELERVQREQRVQRKKLDGQQRMEEKKRRAAHARAMRQACLVKTRASGRDRAMTIEEKKWFVKEFGKQPPRGC